MQGGQRMQDGAPGTSGFNFDPQNIGAGGASAGPASPIGGGGATQGMPGGGIGGSGMAGAGAPGANPFNQQQQAAIDAAAQKVGLFGNVVWLMMQSAAHKHLFLTDMEWLVMPALQLNQFRLWQQNGMPVAYASWAFLDEGAEGRMKESIKRLAPVDWKSGDALWLVDMIAPFGGQEEAIAELRATVFEGRTMKSLQPSPSGEGIAVVEW